MAAPEPLFIDFSDKVIADLKRDTLMSLADGIARMARNEIIEGMDPGPPRTGLTYRVPGTNTTYQASAPGEPPAVREGIYRDAWETTPAVDTGDSIRAAVVNDVRVGKNGEHLLGQILEDGSFGQAGMGGARIAPRPHIRPALERLKPKVRALLQRFKGAK